MIKSLKMENWSKQSTTRTYEGGDRWGVNSEQLGFKWQRIARRWVQLPLLTFAQFKGTAAHIPGAAHHRESALPLGWEEAGN